MEKFKDLNYERLARAAKRYWLRIKSRAGYLFVPKDEKIKFNLKSIYKGLPKVNYRGVAAQRYPFDYVLYQMILSELRPDLIIEIGTNRGGGALYLADLMNNFNHGMLHTIDVVKKSDQLLAGHSRIKLFTQGWEGYDLDEAGSFSKILVIDDGSHVYESTLGALEKFAPLVSVGSYLIVEDGIINVIRQSAEYNGGPLRAIRDFLKIHKNFVVDRAWCDFFGKNATANVNGYLRRVS